MWRTLLSAKANSAKRRLVAQHIPASGAGLPMDKTEKLRGVQP